MYYALIDNCFFALFGTFLYCAVRSIFLCIRHKKRLPIHWLAETVQLFFVFYIVFVVSVTLFPLMFGIDAPMYLDSIRHGINVIPLISIIREFGSIGTAYSGDSLFMIELILKNVGGNILLFVPLGIIAPIWRGKFQTFRATVFLGLLVSIAIETLQFIEILFGTSIRVADIDDVICNGAGAALGYLFYKILIKVARVFRVKLSHQSESASM